MLPIYIVLGCILLFVPVAICEQIEINGRRSNIDRDDKKLMFFTWLVYFVIFPHMFVAIGILILSIYVVYQVCKKVYGMYSNLYDKVEPIVIKLFEVF